MAHGKTLTLREPRPKLYRPLYRQGFVIHADGSVYHASDNGYRKASPSVARAVLATMGGGWK